MRRRPAAVARWAASSTAASAALEGRVVPPGFVRSAAAQAYLDARRLASMTDTTIPPALARVAEAARRLGPPRVADDGDELAALAEGIDPELMAAARAEVEEHQATIEAARAGTWVSPLPEPPDLTRLEFESGTDVYAFWRDDSTSAIAGYGYGPGARTWCEYGRSVPISWHELCATFGVEELEGAVRLLVHPEDLPKLAARPTFRHTLAVLAEHAAVERTKAFAREAAVEVTHAPPCGACGEHDPMGWHDEGRCCVLARRVYAQVAADVA